MFYLLKGLKTYLTDYFFVILLYLSFSGFMDIKNTFYDMFIVEMRHSLECIFMFPPGFNDSSHDDHCSALERGVMDYTENAPDWFPEGAPEEQQTRSSSNETTCFLGSHTEITCEIRMPVAIAVILLLSLLEKRKNVCTQACSGRPTFPIPVNLLDDHDNRIGHLAAFGMTASDALSLLNGRSFISISQLPVWADVFMTAVNVSVVVLLCYPSFACVGDSNRLLRSLLGLFYSLFHVAIVTVEAFECPHNVDITGTSALYEFWASFLPVMICSSIVCLRFFFVVCQELMCLCHLRPRQDEYKPVRDRSCGTYVRHLLAKRRNMDSSNTKRRAWQSEEVGWREKYCGFIGSKLKGCLYRSVPGFKYSTRMLGTLTVSVMLIYQFTVMEIPTLRNASIEIYEQFHQLDFYVQQSKHKNEFETWKRIAKQIDVIMFVSMGISASTVIYFMFDTLNTYRHHILRMFRGDKSFLPEKRGSPTSNLVSCLKYSGYQIGFMFWAYLALQASIGLGIMMVIYQIVLPLREHKSSYFINQLNFIWPSCVFGGAVYLSQLAWAHLCFLQDRGKTMAIDNRRMFHITSFTMFYFNIVLGMISCMSRLFRSLFFGLVFLGRLDRSVLQRNVELLDPGYRAYVGFLVVEETHVHPVLVTFCALLIESQNKKKKHLTGNGTQMDTVTTISKPRARSVRNRWLVAYTLARNPILVHRRAIHKQLQTVDKTVTMWAKAKSKRPLKIAVASIASSGGHAMPQVN